MILYIFLGGIMRRILLFLLFSLPLFSAVYKVPHIADSNWETSVIIYNSGADVAIGNFDVWDNSGDEILSLEFVLPAKTSKILTNNDFGYNCIGVLSSDDSISVKLEYRFINSKSVCQFYLNKEDFSTDWLIVNPGYEELDWFGIALTNFSETNKSVKFNMYKEGQLVKSIDKLILPHRKLLGLSETIFDSLSYDDFDMVTLNCQKGISVPIMIAGDSSQNRHVFLKGQEIEQGDSILKRINLIHSADETWQTNLKVYNPTGNVAEFQIKYGCLGDDCEDKVYSVSPFSFIKLKAGTDYKFSSFSYIESNPVLSYKLSYRYIDSPSVCDFFLGRQKSKKWLISGEQFEWYDWLGFAVTNSGGNDGTYVSFIAYREGEEVGSHAFSLSKNEKFVNLISNIFKDLTLKDIDFIIFSSDSLLNAPISIVGNNEQERHLFSNASALNDENDIYRILAYSDGFGEITPFGVCYFDYGTSATYSMIPSTGYGVGKMLYDGNPMGFYNTFSLTEIGANHVLKAVFSKNIAIPDPQLKRHLTTYYDLDKDGEISEAEALEINGTMCLGSLNISSLVGIEYFKNITKLYCQGNYIKRLDLSNLTKLVELDCSDNNISFLNVAGLQLMKKINCNGNKLIELDISGLRNLVYFYCQGNLIESIDFSDNVNLEELNCKDNKLTFLTLKNLTRLEGLDCSNNQIANFYSTNLDSLWVANFSNNKLKWLFLENYLDLHELDCSNNELDDFNVVSLVNLVSFHCENNEINDIPDITNASNIQYFRCSGNLFGADDCPLISLIIGKAIQGFVYNPQKSGTTLTCP